MTSNGNDVLAWAKLAGVVLGLGAAAWAVWALTRPGAAKAAAQSVAESTAGAATGFAVGTIYGIGDGLGVPRTDANKCQKALAEGRMWDASFDCPAGTFLGGVWDRM